MQPRSQLEQAFSYLQMPYKTWAAFQKDFPKIIEEHMNNPEDPLAPVLDYFLENEPAFYAVLKSELDKRSEAIKNSSAIQIETKEEELKNLKSKIQELEDVKKKINTTTDNPIKNVSDLLDRQKNIKKYLIINFLLKNLSQAQILETKKEYSETMSDTRKKEMIKEHLNNHYRKKLKTMHPDKKSADYATEATKEFKEQKEYVDKSKEILIKALDRPSTIPFYESDFKTILATSFQTDYNTEYNPTDTHDSSSHASSSYSSSQTFPQKSKDYISIDSEYFFKSHFLAPLLNTNDPKQMISLLAEFKSYLEKNESNYLKFIKSNKNLSVYHVIFEYLANYFEKNSYGYDKSNKAIVFIKLVERIPAMSIFFQSELDSIKKSFLGPEPSTQEILNLNYKPSQFSSKEFQNAFKYSESNSTLSGKVFFKLDLNNNFDFDKGIFLLDKKMEKLKENYKRVGIFLHKEASAFGGNVAMFYTNNPYIFHSLQKPFLTSEHEQKDLLTLISSLSNTLLGFPGSDFNGASKGKTAANMENNQLTIAMTNMHYAQQASALLLRACPSLQFKNEITHGSYTFQNPFEAMYYLETICHIPKKQVLAFMKEHLNPTQDLSNQFKEYAENQFQLLIDKLKNKISHIKIDDRVMNSNALFKNKFTIKSQKIEALSKIIVYLMDQNKTDSLSDRLHSKTIQELLKKSPNEAKVVLENLQRELHLFSNVMAPEKTNQAGFNSKNS